MSLSCSKVICKCTDRHVKEMNYSSRHNYKYNNIAVTVYYFITQTHNQENFYSSCLNMKPGDSLIGHAEAKE